MSTPTILLLVLAALWGGVSAAVAVVLWAERQARIEDEEWTAQVRLDEWERRQRR